MKTLLNSTTSRLSLHALTIAIASAIGLISCYETSDPLDVLPPEASGGAGSDSPADSGGSASAGASDAPVGGADNQHAGRGGAGPEAGANMGGKPASGGNPAVGGTESGGAESAGTESGGTESGGAPATGGSTQVLEGGSSGGTVASGGTTASAGGTSEGGSGGEDPPAPESICFDEQGLPLPYDHTYGVATEYAFELSMNCDVGGYLMPLVLADPVELTQVNAFVAEATDWYRAEVLRCEGEFSALGPDAYGLLPASESAELSGGDFEASLSLFTGVIDRHDGQPDGVSKDKKDKIKQRIKSVKQRAVHGNTEALTKTLSEPDCVPSAPPGGA